MKIEVIDKNNIAVFINCLYVDNDDLNSKDNIVVIVKDFIKKYKSNLHLRGFYKVRVYVDKKVGLFLDIVRLEEIDVSNNVDLRVIVNMDDDIYFETEDYEIIPNDIEKYYYNNKFYCNVRFLPNILCLVEFGRFIYGKEVLEILDNAVVV